MFCNDGANEDYTLFKVFRGTGVHLIDNEGNHLWEWMEPDDLRGVTMILTENGTLIRNNCWNTSRCGGNGEMIREYDWHNNVIWQFYYPGAHHDMVRLPNGNLLITVTQADRTESLMEVKPDYQNWNPDLDTIQPGEGGKIVWQWFVRDHVGADNPELFYTANYRTLNALDYHPQRDEILMSFNSSNEIIVIRRPRTTKQAAGEKGHILYRWGNPANYGAPGDQKTARQHSTKWIKRHEFGYFYKDVNLTGVGDILWVNNGNNRVDEIAPPIQGNGTGGKYVMDNGGFGPSDATLIFNYDGLFDAGLQSSSQRLPNGNTLIALSNDMTFIEVNPDREIVWKFVNPFCTYNWGGGPQPTADYLRLWNYESCEDLGFGFADSTLHFNVKRFSPDFKGFRGKPFKDPIAPLVPLP